MNNQPLSLLQQLMAAQAHAAANQKQDLRFGPKPHMRHYRHGSASARVDAALLMCHPRILSCSELRRMTGLSRGALAWALRYLHERNRLLRYSHPSHPQYLRYKFNVAVLGHGKADD